MENIRPIRTEEDYEWALREITAYFDNQPAVGSPEGDRFDVLATLIEAYEDSHYPIAVPDPVELLSAHMDLRGFSQSDLGNLFGSRSRASEVLNRKRALTMDMVFRLNSAWGIPAEALIRPYHLGDAAKTKA
jgi:HTH-type transcriptional regulator/antitoxin HigA